MPSLMNGLSQMGAGIAQFAGTAGLEAQKGALQQQAIQLSAQLEHANRTAEIAQQGTIQSGIVGQQIAGQKDVAGIEAASREKTAGISAGATLGAANISAAASRDIAKIQAEALPPDVKEAIFLSNATPEQRAAYREAQTARLGLPAWATGDTTGITTPPAGSTSQPTSGTPVPAGGDTTAPPDTTGTAKPANGAPAATEGRYNEDALKGMPAPAQDIVRGMVTGRIQPPGSYAMSRPGSIWQPLMAKAMQYDPTFDETTWTTRNATRKDLAPNGTTGKAVTAMNTALGHAGLVADKFEALNNGSVPAWNTLINWIHEQAGDQAPGNAQGAVLALASEARKVFATTGGGGERELEEWKSTFPINGSPSQQHAALERFVDLLNSRLQSVADTVNRGLGTADDPIGLLNSNAQAVYRRLTGQQPENSTVYQTGKPPSSQATAPATSAAVLPMVEQDGRSVPDASKLKDGAIYAVPGVGNARFDAKRMGFVPIQ